MVMINFQGVEDAQDYAPVPAGIYTCRVIKVDESMTNSGDPMFKFIFEIVSGEHKGKHIYDNMPFSEGALKRAKLICKRFGFNTEGSLDIKPSMFLDKPIKLDVGIEDSKNKDGSVKLDNSGKPMKRNVVGFAGYIAIESGETPPPMSEQGKALKDLPF